MFYIITNRPMFKKIFTFALIFISISSVFGLEYDFSHFPSDIDSEKTTYKIKKDFQYLRYEWKTYEKSKNVDISPIIKYIKNIGYFNFFKISHYWDRWPDRINDNKIDLDYLTEKKLKYPIAGLHVRDKIIFFIYEDLISNQDKEKIGQKYQSDEMGIAKYQNWYITYINYSFDSNFPYQAKEYTDLIQNMYQKWAVNLQLGQNPYDMYDIDGFSNNIIQLELAPEDKLIGLILSLKKQYTPTLDTSYKHKRKYKEDIQMVNKLRRVYDVMQKHYKDTGFLPKTQSGLTRLNQMWYAFNTTELTKHRHQLTYNRLNYRCYKIGFQPKSKVFKKIQKFNINDGYWIWKYCIN